MSDLVGRVISNISSTNNVQLGTKGYERVHLGTKKEVKFAPKYDEFTVKYGDDTYTVYVNGYRWYTDVIEQELLDIYNASKYQPKGDQTELSMGLKMFKHLETKYHYIINKSQLEYLFNTKYKLPGISFYGIKTLLRNNNARSNCIWAVYDYLQPINPKLLTYYDNGFMTDHLKYRPGKINAQVIDYKSDLPVDVISDKFNDIESLLQEAEAYLQIYNKGQYIQNCLIQNTNKIPTLSIENRTRYIECLYKIQQITATNN